MHGGASITGWRGRVRLRLRVVHSICPIAVLECSLAVLLAGWCPTAVLASGAKTGPHAAATASPAPRQPMIVNAAFSHVDYQAGTATFTDIRVVQGDTRLTAERARASGLSLRNSRWIFGGNVLIDVQPSGTLRSDCAVVQIRDDRIIVATFTGHPALFEQQRTHSHEQVHGHADNIVYNVSEDTARLSGDPWISDGHNEISAPLLVYNFRDETIQAASPSGRRVHITLSPRPARGSRGRQAPAGEGPRRPPSQPRHVQKPFSRQ